MKLSGDTPWAGVKQSGLGKEIGIYGMEEFTNRKLVVVGLGK